MIKLKAVKFLLVEIMEIVFIGIVIFLFLSPSIIAFNNGHPYKLGILITNTIGSLFFGAGWLVALIWSVSKPKNQTVKNAADEIDKLNKLREKGIISDTEFNNKKENILKV